MSPLSSDSSHEMGLTCGRCHSASRVAGFVLIRDPDRGDLLHSLAPRDHVLGRERDCDLQVGADSDFVSRRHALLVWKSNRFEIVDERSRHGTFVNGSRVSPGDSVVLSDRDLIRLGETEISFFAIPSPDDTPLRISYEHFLCQVREMNSLDAATIVPHALDLLRLVSRVERSYLVGTGLDPHLEPLLTPLDDPDLAISRSSIEEAVRTRRRVARFVEPERGTFPTKSMAEHMLRRVWVKPILAQVGEPVAVVYLDSPGAGWVFSEETESLMEAVVEHIGIVLRNASLHAELAELNRDLETKVAERTRELEDSRTELIGKDRLATLGRLVAAIAHELNNPVGATASMAETLSGLLDAIVGLENAVAAIFPDPQERDAARRLVGTALAAAEQAPSDSRTRRALEAAFETHLTQRGIAGAETIARRLARMGLAAQSIEPFLPLLQQKGEPLSAILEQAWTFRRGLETIREASANVARIVDGLKTYAHIDKSEFEVADIHRSIQATLSVLGARMSHGIAVETRFAPIEPFPHRPGELTQVWTNLIDNAVGAMGEAGTLTVETVDDGPTVRVIITDTGPGIPQALADRIFELHVTSRGPGAGLGLGLPICKTIVEKNHGGRIASGSRPGHTTFTVEIPKTPPTREGPS